MSETYFKIGAALDPNTPAEVLEKLAEDEDWRVKENAAKSLVARGVRDEVIRNIEKESIFSVKMHGFERWFKNKSGLDVANLCKAYAECQRPYADMEQYGEPIDIGEFASIKQSDKLLFSVDFDVDEDEITIFDGETFKDIPLKETIHKISMEKLNRMSDEEKEASSPAHHDTELFNNNDFIGGNDMVDKGKYDWRATSPFTSAEMFMEFAESENYFVRRDVARNPKAPPEVLKKLAQKGDKIIKKAVAQNLNTSVNVLEQLAGDKDKDVRECVAGNVKTPVETLMRLAGDKEIVGEGIKTNWEWWFKRCVASHPGTSPEMLEQLAEDKIWDVRAAVAKNPNTPVEVLEQLARDKDKDVRNAATSNPNISHDSVEFVEVAINHSQIMRVTEKNVAICISEENGIKQYIELSRDKLAFHNNKYFINMPAESKLLDTMKASNPKLTPENDKYSKRSGSSVDVLKASKPKAI